ncbi:hypothetical protein pdam_00018513, partial [Pocillopora damicornis]
RTSSSKLQRVRNTAAKLLLKQLKFNQIASLLFQLSTAKNSRLFYYASKQYIIPTKYELWSNLKLVLMTIRRKILPTQEARTIPSAAPYLMNRHISKSQDRVHIGIEIETIVLQRPRKFRPVRSILHTKI